MIVDETPSKIEIAKVLKQVKTIAATDSYESIKEVLCPPAKTDEVEKAISGLREEDEFIFLSMMMETAENITPLEQRQSIAQNSAAPDLMITFRPGFYSKNIPSSNHSGFPCLVEIKSTKKKKYRMSGAALAKLRHYADSYGMPLLFAVRNTNMPSIALWLIVEDIDRSKKSITIDFGNLLQGLRSVLWDDFYYMILPGTTLISIYEKRKKGFGVTNKEYGSQVGFDVVTSKKRHKYKGVKALIAASFFAPFGLNKLKAVRIHDKTIVTYTTQNAVLSVADLVYGLNCLPTNVDGEKTYDPGRVMRKMVDGKLQYVASRRFVENTAYMFLKIGALRILEMGETEDRYVNWLQTGGNE